jgi:hypothetical protein
MKVQKFRPAWDEKRVKELIARRERQTEDIAMGLQSLATIRTALSGPRETS